MENGQSSPTEQDTTAQLRRLSAEVATPTANPPQLHGARGLPMGPVTSPQQLGNTSLLPGTAGRGVDAWHLAGQQRMARGTAMQSWQSSAQDTLTPQTQKAIPSGRRSMRDRAPPPVNSAHPATSAPGGSSSQGAPPCPPPPGSGAPGPPRSQGNSRSLPPSQNPM